MKISKTSPIMAILLPLLGHALPQTYTLYDIGTGGTDAVGPMSASFVSTDTEGATVWAVQKVVTEVDIGGGSTSDIPATTLLGTIVEDNKSFAYYYFPKTFDIFSTTGPHFDADILICAVSGNDASCVDKQWYGTETQTTTESFTGTIEPIHTVTGTGIAERSTGVPTVTTKNGPAATSTASSSTGVPQSTASGGNSGAATNQVATMAVILGVMGSILTL